MHNKDLMDIDSEEGAGDDSSDPEPEPLKELMEGKDNESEGHSSEDDGKQAFVNPLAKQRKTIDAKGEISEGEWSDEDENDNNGKEAKKNKAKKDKKLLGKRKRNAAGSDDEEAIAKDFFGNNIIEEVPANDPGAIEN
jgi:hypothetical protein